MTSGEAPERLRVNAATDDDPETHQFRIVRKMIEKGARIDDAMGTMILVAIPTRTS